MTKIINIKQIEFRRDRLVNISASQLLDTLKDMSDILNDIDASIEYTNTLLAMCPSPQKQCSQR